MSDSDSDSDGGIRPASDYESSSSDDGLVRSGRGSGSRVDSAESRASRRAAAAAEVAAVEAAAQAAAGATDNSNGLRSDNQDGGFRMKAPPSLLSPGQGPSSPKSQHLQPPSPSRLSMERASQNLTVFCESLNPFKEKPRSKAFVLSRISKIVAFLKSEDVHNHVGDLELDYMALLHNLRPLLESSDTLVRTACFRLMRHFVLEKIAIDALNNLSIHLFVIGSLESKKLQYLERMEALKLCRRIIEVECSLLERGVVSSLVAIASQPKDAKDEFRGVVLETLRQLAMRDTAAVAQCNGIPCLISAITDPSLSEMSKSLTLTLVYLLGQPGLRKYFRPSLQLGALLSPFTDAEGAELPGGRARWKPCQNALVLLLKTWTGLYYLASDPAGLHSLVQMMVQPVSLDLKQVILETIFLVFLHLSPYIIKYAGPSYVSEDGKNGQEKNQNRHGARAPHTSEALQEILEIDWGIGPNSLAAEELAGFGLSTEHFPRSQTEPHAVMNQFLAITLDTFVGCGLIEALLFLCLKENPPISKMAAQLLGLLMRTSERIFPQPKHLKIFSLSELVNKATSFEALYSSDPSVKLCPRRAARILSLISATVGASYDTTISSIRARETFVDSVALCSELSIPTSSLFEYERQSVGINPRGEIASLPYSAHLVASLLLEHSLGSNLMTEAEATSGSSRHISGGSHGQSPPPLLISPTYRQESSISSPNSISSTLSAGARKSSSKRLSAKIISSLKSPITLVSKSRQAEKRVLESADVHQRINHRLAEAMEHREREGLGTISGRSLLHALDGNAANATRPNYPLSNRGHRRHVRTKILTQDAYSDLDDLNLKVFNSQVLQGKDWTKWRWDVIDEIVTGSMRHRGLVVELLKTKFVKRVMGFFRATGVGEFLALPYRAGYEPYTAVCISMLHALMEVPDGLEFLRYDRRGKIHKQIIEALSQELGYHDGTSVLSVPGGEGGGSITTSYSHGSGSAHNDSVSSAKVLLASSYFSVAGRRDSTIKSAGSVPVPTGTTVGFNAAATLTAAVNQTSDETVARIFSPIACTRSMTRAFGPILGAYTSHSSGVELLEREGFLNLLSELSRIPSKEYLVRLFLPYLDFSHTKPFRGWLQSVLLHGGLLATSASSPTSAGVQYQSSNSLVLFILGFFRAQMRRRHAQVNTGFSSWIIEMLWSLLFYGGNIASSCISILNELAYYPSYLDILVAQDFTPLRPFIGLHFARPLLFKLVGTRRGFLALEKLGWIEAAMLEWQACEVFKYAARYETLMTLKLLCRNEPLTAIPQSYELAGLLSGMDKPDREDLAEAVEQTFGLEAAARNATRHLIPKQVAFHPERIPVTVFEANAISEPGFAAPDILSLTKLPWAVELWLKTTQGDLVYIPVDTFLDCAHLTGPEFGVAELGKMSKELRGDSSEFGSRENETIHRDLCAVATPDQGATSIARDATLYACVTLAGEPLLRNGRTASPPEGGGGFCRPYGTHRDRHVSSVGGSAVADESNFFAGNAHSGRGSTSEEQFLDYSLTTRSSYPDLDDNKFWIKLGPEHLAFETRAAAGVDLGDLGHDGEDEDDEDFSPRQACTSPPKSLLSNPAASPSATGESASHASHKYKARTFSVCPGTNSTATFTFCEDGDSLALQRVSFHLGPRPDCPNATYIPSHFFGELARSQNGANYLRSIGYLQELVQDLADGAGFGPNGPSQGSNASSCGELLTHRATLWTLGHIGGSESGLSVLLEQQHVSHNGEVSNVVKLIADIASSSQVLPLRGTAVLALGLISKSERGRRILQCYGWETQTSGNEIFGFVVVPQTYAAIFNPIHFDEPGPRVWDGLSYSFTNPDERVPVPGLPSEVVDEALDAVSKLMNQITLKEAHKTLCRLKMSHPQVFKSPLMLLRVHEFLENFTYELWVRHFLYKMFHKDVAFHDIETWNLLDQ